MEKERAVRGEGWRGGGGEWVGRGNNLCGSLLTIPGAVTTPVHHADSGALLRLFALAASLKNHLAVSCRLSRSRAKGLGGDLRGFGEGQEERRLSMFFERYRP